MLYVLLCLQEEVVLDKKTGYCNYWVQEVSEGLMSCVAVKPVSHHSCYEGGTHERACDWQSERAGMLLFVLRAC